MKFFDCGYQYGTIINLEHIVSINVDKRILQFSNGDEIWFTCHPELFESIMCKIRQFMI